MHDFAAPAPATFGPARSPLGGTIRVPGDKSISHRALMFGAIAIGRTVVDGLLDSEDVQATAAALRAMGATIARDGDRWTIDGVGVGGLLQPAGALDMGNSGTSTRLLMGLVASHAITATFTGDASLSRRPMARVIDPLAMMGAAITPSPGGRLPLMVRGLVPAIPIDYRLPVASAQVKSAVLLAGLNTPGITSLVEGEATRDHSERMLAAFGAAVSVTDLGDGTRRIAVRGPADLRAQAITVPGDPSSAAFPMVAATIVPGSDVTITGVGMNATRTGLLTVLRQMGADIGATNERQVGGEPVADLRVRAARLEAIAPDPAIVPSMVDEFPILFIAAALARGTSVFTSLAELRVKESDRITTMADGLRAIGVTVRERDDGLEIDGRDGVAFDGGGPIATRLDHRIAMSFAVAGLASTGGVAIDDCNPVATSFPGFANLLAGMQR